MMMMMMMVMMMMWPFYLMLRKGSISPGDPHTMFPWNPLQLFSFFPLIKKEIFVSRKENTKRVWAEKSFSPPDWSNSGAASWPCGHWKTLHPLVRQGIGIPPSPHCPQSAISLFWAENQMLKAGAAAKIITLLLMLLITQLLIQPRQLWRAIKTILPLRGREDDWRFETRFVWTTWQRGKMKQERYTSVALRCHHGAVGLIYRKEKQELQWVNKQECKIVT